MPSRTAVMCLTATLLAIAAAAAIATAATPSLSVARAYAHRTYVLDSSLGARPFAVVGHRSTVRAADGSTISAFATVIADSGDGSGQAVLLFRNGRFLGWASAFDTLHLSLLAPSGTAIRVRYGAYSGDDPFCCPSSTRTVSYRWVDHRIVADKQPPLIYGRQGDRLHLRPAG